MGKLKKKAAIQTKKAEDEPYEAIAMPKLAKKVEEEEARTVEEDDVASEDMAVDAAGEVAAVDVTKMTKGALKKRQHMEWKKLRKSLEELGKEKRTYSNRDPEEKKERKTLRKHMIGLKRQMEQRHKDELAAWEAAHADKKEEEELAAIEAPKQTKESKAELKNMFAHFM